MQTSHTLRITAQLFLFQTVLVPSEEKQINCQSGFATVCAHSGSLKIYTINIKTKRKEEKEKLTFDEPLK